jgi:hypothetical protein
MTKMTIPAIIQKAAAQGTVFSVKEKSPQWQDCVRGHDGSGQHRQDELLRPRNRRADIRLTAGSESRIRRKTDKVGPVRGRANPKATSSEEEGDEDSDRLRFDNGNLDRSGSGTGRYGGRGVVQEMPTLP